MADAAQTWPVPWQAVEGDRDGPWARVEAAVILGTVGAAARLPAAGQDAAAALLARVMGLLDRRHTQSGRRFVAQAFPDLDARARNRLVIASWKHLISLTLREASFERHVPPERVLEHVRFQLCPDFERVRASGSGSIFALPHLGHWELLPQFVRALGMGPVYAVARPPRNLPLSRYVQRRRESHGQRLLHRHGAASAIPRIVAAGGHVGMLVDQRARKKTVQVPFFGRLAHCERGIAVLLKRVRVPVVIAACFERPGEPWQFDMEVPQVLWPEELAGSTPAEITLKLNQVMERMILAHPEQYFWLHDRYRKAPDEVASALT